MANQVTLTFAGDTASLDRAFERVGAGSRSVTESVGGASDAVDEHGNALGRMGDKADGSEANLIGVVDIMSGSAAIMKGPGAEGLGAYIQGWADLAGGLAPVLMSLAQVKLATIGSTIANAAHATSTAVVSGATTVWTRVQLLMNTALLTSPITWIVLGIVALVAVIVLIATKTTWFQDAWRVAWSAIKSVASAVWDWMQGLPGKIGTAFRAIFDFITWPFRTAFNFVADAWNNTIGRLSWTVPQWVPFIGGNTISAPKLPKFHSGGVVPGMPGQEVLAVLQAGERVLTRRQQTAMGAGVGAGVTNIYVTLRLEDLKQLKDLEDFLDLLRNNNRRGLEVAAA